jgi:hypothetical protein
MCNHDRTYRETLLLDLKAKARAKIFDDSRCTATRSLILNFQFHILNAKAAKDMFVAVK